MIHYLDTSAAFKALIHEDESDALVAHLSEILGRGGPLVSSWLLYTELHCAAGRRNILSPTAVTGLLDNLTLVDIDRSDLIHAGASEWGLRSADAIHLTTALRLEVTHIIAYDDELLDAAMRVGIRGVTPGATR